MLRLNRCLICAITTLSFALPQPFIYGQETARSQDAPVVMPKIWDAKALENWATPLAGLGVAPGFVSEADYYAAPIDNLRTYPVYHPSREPPGYRDALIRRGPLPLIEPDKLHTKSDWIEAGRRVFEELDTALLRSADPAVLAHFTNAAAIDKYRDEFHDTMTNDGILIDYRWVVDRDRKLKLSMSSCAGCHTRIMPDGTLLRGAPCNFDVSSAPPVESMLDQLRLAPMLSMGQELYIQFGVPWLKNDPNRQFKDMSDEQLLKFMAQDSGDPPGTMVARFNGSPLYKTRMADLRGVRDRRYLDATATHSNRGPEDIARYGILVEFADAAVFGTHRMLPPDTKLRVRPPDEAMYALGLYVYSLNPAKSPYPFDEKARHGQELFESEGCTECHTPPVYTNNKLVAVPGFEPNMDDPATKRLDISKRRVGTDPGLALNTRKGTGYYKIPSLRGLWYRGLYEHTGSVTSLEDWFDPKRLKDDYVPSGFRGRGVKTRAVPGHKFGHDLSPEDKRDLIAFLRTL